ncbi:helix-turn-helix transcriptional regulator, partial [Priestia flexa]|uniref:helix-turn-helix transcriptional regulator n=1 Tax=Priestia flexa TaxID=86664 RepID=UPI001F4CCE9A
MLEIAVKIKMLRANAGLTQDQFAKLLNISRSKVSKWETSIQYPDIADCLLLKSHFKINLDEFLESTPHLKQPHKLNSSPWYVNTKLDNFLKVSMLVINWACISKG